MGWQLYRIAHLTLEVKQVTLLHGKRHRLFVNILGRIGRVRYMKIDMIVT